MRLGKSQTTVQVDAHLTTSVKNFCYSWNCRWWASRTKRPYDRHRGSRGKKLTRQFVPAVGGTLVSGLTNQEDFGCRDVVSGRATCRLVEGVGILQQLFHAIKVRRQYAGHVSFRSVPLREPPHGVGRVFVSLLPHSIGDGWVARNAGFFVLWPWKLYAFSIDRS